MTKPFKVQITFQVTEEISVEALSPDDAVSRAIEALDERHRLVHADSRAHDQE